MLAYFDHYVKYIITDGGPAASAQLGAWGLAFDSSGNLYVADPWNRNIRLLKAQ
jgi:hypothetical protein